MQFSRIPIRQSEKSYLVGSSGANFLKAFVTSTAVFKLAVFLLCRHRVLLRRVMWTSRGEMSFALSTFFHRPASMRSLRTTQRRNRNILLQVLLLAGLGKRYLRYFELCGGEYFKRFVQKFVRAGVIVSSFLL